MSKLKIKTKERRFETARDLYGIFEASVSKHFRIKSSVSGTVNVFKKDSV